MRVTAAFLLGWISWGQIWMYTLGCGIASEVDSDMKYALQGTVNYIYRPNIYNQEDLVWDETLANSAQEKANTCPTAVEAKPTSCDGTAVNMGFVYDEVEPFNDAAAKQFLLMMTAVEDGLDHIYHTDSTVTGCSTSCNAMLKAGSLKTMGCGYHHCGDGITLVCLTAPGL